MPARRDVILANAVRTTDFFDSAAKAWASIGNITNNIQTISDVATRLERQTEDDVNDRYMGGDASERANFEQESSEGTAENDINDHHMGGDASERANLKQEPPEGTADDDDSPRSVTPTRYDPLDGDHMTRELKAAQEGAKRLDDVSRLSSRALSAARGGEMARAREIADEAKTAADGAETESETVRKLRKEALSVVQEWLQDSMDGA